MYAQQVMSPAEQKMKQRIDWEQNGGHEYQKLLAERQAKKDTEIKSLKNNCLNSLQHQMNYKEIQKAQR